MQHLSLAKVSKQSVTKFIAKILMNLVTPKAATKLVLLIKKLAFKAGLCNT